MTSPTPESPWTSFDGELVTRYRSSPAMPGDGWNLLTGVDLLFALVMTYRLGGADVRRDR